MRISKEIKELAKEIHKAEHFFVDKKRMDKDHGCIFNKIVDVQNEIRDLSQQMKEVSKQQKYLWQTFEEKKGVHKDAK